MQQLTTWVLATLVVSSCGTLADESQEATVQPSQAAAATSLCAERIPTATCGTPAPVCPAETYPGHIAVHATECGSIVEWSGECLACKPSCPERIPTAQCGVPPRDCPTDTYPGYVTVRVTECGTVVEWSGECLACR